MTRHTFKFLSAAVISIASLSGIAAACPPSEGEMDLRIYDISGNGSVQLPEGARWKVLPEIKSKDEKGVEKTDSRMALVLEDPTNANTRVLTLHLEVHAADIIARELDMAVRSQEQRANSDPTIKEKAGLECTLNAKVCNSAAKRDKDGKPNKQIALPRMMVMVGSGVEWRTNDKGEMVPNPADRITLRTYDLDPPAQNLNAEANDEVSSREPLLVKMDLKSAKTLLKDLNDMMAIKTGAKQPEPAKPEAKPAQRPQG